MGNLSQMAQQQLDVKQFVRMEAIISSMTPAERRDPELLNGSRKRRITQGSGTDIQDLTRLLKQGGGATAADSEQVEFQLRQADVQRRKAQRDVELTRVVAPFAGVVTTRLARPRRFVEVGNTLFRVTESAPLFARVRVPEAGARQLRVGDTASIAAGTGFDYTARIVYVGDPGSGCSDNQYKQFNTSAVAGPTYGSVGLESGRFLLGGCPDHTVDMALAKNFRVGGTRSLQFRLDVFNVFNTVIYNDRVTTVQYRSPTDQTIVNSQYLPDGTLDPNRLTPRTAGFGAATSAQPLRNMQLQIRFGF